MIDIETLGNGPTSLILSIGAVQFDIDSHTIGTGFHTHVDIDSCLKAGLTIDGSTISWWMTQPDAARELFNKGSDAVSLATALVLLQGYLSDNSKAPIIWCNGSNFDAPILDNAFHKCEMRSPWQYYNVRDYRTIKAMLPKKTFEKLRELPEIAHDAYHDALAQARTLQNIMSLGKAVEFEDVQQA